MVSLGHFRTSAGLSSHFMSAEVSWVRSVRTLFVYKHFNLLTLLLLLLLFTAWYVLL